jgi:tRNA A-37 threonylcarbamoyl transferase component Bud32
MAVFDDGAGLSFIVIVGSLIVSIQFHYLVKKQKKLENDAIAGDAAAASKIILPCYTRLFQFMMYLYIVFAVAVSWTFMHPHATGYARFATIQYFAYNQLVVYTWVPALFIQKHVSNGAFKRTAKLLFPWWALCTGLWIDSCIRDNSVVDVFFTISAAIVPLVVIFAHFFRLIPCRLKFRELWVSMVYVSVYIFLFSVVNIIYDIWDISDGGTRGFSDSDKSYTKRRIFAGYTLVAFSFIWNLMFPAFMLPTLRSDTQFWRGMSSSRGLRLRSDSFQLSDVGSGSVSSEISSTVERGPVDMFLAAIQLPHMMKEIGQYTIDFTLLKKGKYLAKGASAKVYKGTYKNNSVAIKIYSPPELTDEVINAFQKETEIMFSFQHRNVVNFYGICVRPPDIALVIELCSRGDLKSNLVLERSYWSSERKLRACIEAARGLAYLHARNIIHRDFKTNNCFVFEDHTVKIGDFGEAAKAAANDERAMSIVGTVNYMSPELIQGVKHYTSAIDIYAFGISLAEIWSGDEPFANAKSTFKIYEMINSGIRPTLPTDLPEGLSSLIHVIFMITINIIN